MGIEKYDFFFLYIVNVFMLILFFVCIVCGCEYLLRDVDFVVVLGVMIFNVFDVLEVYFVVV